MSYVKPGKSLAPKTELNDHTVMYDRAAELRRLAEPPCEEPTLPRVLHRSWCQDDTCYCRKGE